MPFALIIIGAVLLVAAVQGTEKDLGDALYNDFTGSGSFVWWMLSILAVGAIGYVPDLKKFSVTFMALLLVALILSNRGAFAQFNSELSTATTAPETLPGDPNTSPFTAAPAASSGAINVGSIAQVGGLLGNIL